MSHSPGPFEAPQRRSLGTAVRPMGTGMMATGPATMPQQRRFPVTPCNLRVRIKRPPPTISQGSLSLLSHLIAVPVHSRMAATQRLSAVQSPIAHPITRRSIMPLCSQAAVTPSTPQAVISQLAVPSQVPAVRSQRQGATLPPSTPPIPTTARPPYPAARLRWAVRDLLITRQQSPSAAERRIT